MKILRLSTFCGLLLFVSNTSFGQAPAADSSALATTTTTLNRHYARAVGQEAYLYTGVEYVEYVKPYVRGHQFFGNSEFHDTTVEYNGVAYPAVPMRYDLVLEQLVLDSPAGGMQMRLLNERVSRFTMDGHTFVRILADTASRATLRTGYYDLLVDGPVQLLASRRKSVQETSTPSGLEGEVEARNFYFIHRGAQYHEVSSANSVVNLFPARKAALRKYIRTQQLKFKKTTRESSIVALVQYLGTLPAGASTAN